MLRGLRHCLALIGRHASKGYVAALLAGLCLPWLSASARPLLPWMIVWMVGTMFARADLGGVRAALTRPVRLALTVAFSVLAMPAVALLIVLLVGRSGLDLGLLMGLALIAGAPPMQSSPIYAALLGFDNSMILAVLVISMVLAPLTAPPLASLVIGLNLPIDPVDLSLRLIGLLGAAFSLAAVLRLTLGRGRLTAMRQEFDGLNVLVFFLFAIAAMDGVIAMTVADPWRSVRYIAVATAVSWAGFLVALVATRPLGRRDGFSVSLGVGFRNTGLLVAPLGAAIPHEGYLFFSLLQIPIFLAPLTAAPVARMILRRDARAVAQEPAR